MTPALLLIGVAASIAVPSNLESMQEAGPHGLSEMLYAFASASNNNGSAFGGFGANTPWFNTALGLCMMLAGSCRSSGARPRRIVRQAEARPGHRRHLPHPQTAVVGMVVGVTLVLVALTFLPVLALGPLAEGLQ